MRPKYSWKMCHGLTQESAADVFWYLVPGLGLREMTELFVEHPLELEEDGDMSNHWAYRVAFLWFFDIQGVLLTERNDWNKRERPEIYVRTKAFYISLAFLSYFFSFTQKDKMNISSNHPWVKRVVKIYVDFFDNLISHILTEEEEKNNGKIWILASRK